MNKPGKETKAFHCLKFVKIALNSVTIILDKKIFFAALKMKPFYDALLFDSKYSPPIYQALLVFALLNGLILLFLRSTYNAALPFILVKLSYCQIISVRISK